jgi:hypothetical protein
MTIPYDRQAIRQVSAGVGPGNATDMEPSGLLVIIRDRLLGAPRNRWVGRYR